MPAEHITQSILVFRDHKVLLDVNLAALYGVQTGALVQAVKRDIGRFPADFMFQLTAAEWTVLRSRIVIPTSSRGEAIAAILSAIRELMAPPPPPPKRRPIGFTAPLIPR